MDTAFIIKNVCCSPWNPAATLIFLWGSCFFLKKNSFFLLALNLYLKSFMCKFEIRGLDKGDISRYSQICSFFWPTWNAQLRLLKPGPTLGASGPETGGPPHNSHGGCWTVADVVEMCLHRLSCTAYWFTGAVASLRRGTQNCVKNGETVQWMEQRTKGENMSKVRVRVSLSISSWFIMQPKKIWTVLVSPQVYKCLTIRLS